MEKFLITERRVINTSALVTAENAARAVNAYKNAKSHKDSAVSVFNVNEDCNISTEQYEEEQ